VAKDKILFRVRAFNVVQLFDFLTTRFEAYYKRRVCNTLNNRQENHTAYRYFIPEKKLEPMVCQKISEDIFSVTNTSKGTKYEVTVAVEVCSCPVGSTGAPCKHQFAVVRQFKLTSSLFLPVQDAESKQRLHVILYGKDENIPADWYQSLHGGTNQPSDQQPPVEAAENGIRATGTGHASGHAPGHASIKTNITVTRRTRRRGGVAEKLR